MKKTTDQANEILEDAATNTNQWPREKTTPVKAVGGTDNKVLNNLVNHVTQLTKQLTRQQGTANSIQTNPWELCEFCGGQHNSDEWQSAKPNSRAGPVRVKVESESVTTARTVWGKQLSESKSRPRVA